MAEGVKSVLVQGIPEHIDNSAAVEQLTIHFQKHVISGRDAEVDAVHLVQLPPNQRAFVVVFGNGEESVNAVLQKKQNVHSVVFDGNLVQLSVTACPLNIEAGFLPSSTRLNMGDDFNNPKQDSFLDDSTTEEGENKTDFVPDETVKYPNIQEGTPDSEQSARYPPTQFSAENYGFFSTSGRDYPADSSTWSSLSYSQHGTPLQDPNVSASMGSDQPWNTPPRSSTPNMPQAVPSGANRQMPQDSKGQQIDPSQMPPGWNPYQYSPAGMYPGMPPGMYPGMNYPPNFPQQYPGYPGFNPQMQQPQPRWPQANQPAGQRPQHDKSGRRSSQPMTEQVTAAPPETQENISEEVLQKFLQSLPPDQQAQWRSCPLEYVSFYFKSLPPEQQKPFLSSMTKDERVTSKMPEADTEECEDSVTEDCTLEVTGFKEGTSQEMLEMYFESERKSGGGPLVDHEMKDDTTFVVTFESAEVAERVVNHGNHVLKGSPFTVTWYKPVKDEEQEPVHEDDSVTDDCTVEVTGFKEGTSYEMLEMYFESERKSGGGHLVDHEMKDDTTFVVTFESAEVAERVMDRGNHVLGGNLLTVKWFIPTKEESRYQSFDEDIYTSSVNPCMLEVTGFKEGTSYEMLEMYFESERKSGGGPLVDHEMKDETTFVVTFENLEVTERVLGHDHVLDGVKLTVRQPKISDTDDTIQLDPCKLEVTGFKKGTSEEALEMYFESKKKSGGGPLAEYEMKDDETFVITYESPEVAERVLSQERHVLEGRPLIVKQFQPTREKKIQHELSDHEDTIQVDPCKLEVTGFKKETSEETLEMYFESKRKSGGGPFAACEMKDDETFVITYESPEVAERVLNHGKHALGRRPLIVQQFQPTREEKKQHELSDHEESDSEEEEEANCTIEVTGFPPDTSTETLELYFESKRSGGGPIESSNVINGVLVITFESPDDAARILERQNHKISKMKLTVREPAKKKKKPKLPRDRKSFLLRGLADGTKREHLELYLETCTGMEDDAELLFGEEPDMVLVRYDDEIKDFENIKKKIGKRKLNKAKITVEPVHLTNCIMVKNLPPNVTDDTLELYFEAKKKSGGGEVVDVEMKEDTGTALVSFKDYKVLDSVLSKQHKVYKKAIEVQPYYECLGEVVSSDEPPARIPDPITIKAHPNVLNYITSKPQYLEELKKSLSKVYAQHEWPAAGSNDSILIIPSFPEEVENRHQKCKDWSKTVNEALSKFLKNFKCADVSVLEGIWLQVISQKAGWATGEVEVIDDQNSSRILITGRLERVEQVEDKVNQVIKDIEDQMQKAKKMIKENQKLDILKIKQLLMCNFSKTAMAKFPDLTVKVTLKSKQISFNGLPNDVNAAKCDMYETMSKMPKMSFKPPNQSYVEFLQLPGVSQRIYDMFKQSRIQAIYFVGDDGIVLSTMSQEDLATASKIIQRSIVEEKIQLQPRSLPAIQKQEWQKLVTQLQEDHVTKIDIPKGDKKTVLIIGFQTEIQTVLAQLKDYIAVNTEVDESVKIESGRMKYIDAYKTDAMVRIENGGQRLPLQLHSQATGSSVLVTIKGAEDDVKMAVKQLRQLADSVCRRPYPVDKPGMAKLFREEKGKSYLRMVEDQCQCKIDVNDPSDEDNKGTGDFNEEGFENRTLVPQPTTYHILCYHIMQDRRRIVVGKGDLTKMHVDAIINAANSRLDSSGGGLTKAIADAGGPDLQGECQQMISRSGKLFEGQAAVTGPGNLPCKNVIHAVAPMWHGSTHRYSNWEGQGPRREELLLTDAVCNSLKIAEKLGHTSIGIPAIGSGGLGFPLDLCVKTIIGAVHRHCSSSKPRSLMEIRFVDNSDATCQQFQDSLIELYGSGSVVVTSEEAAQDDDDDWQLVRSHRAAKSSDEESEEDSSANVQATKDPYVVKTAENKNIKLIKGSIAKSKVDVLVNTTQTTLDLNTGAVSKAILQVAGRQLQQEVDIQKTEVSNNEGDVIVTPATGKLKCKKVYHVLCCQWDSSGKAEKILRGILQKCFDMADQCGMKSIAIPAIGTGGLKYPKDTTAKIMYEEAKSFSSKKPQSQLTDIRFVVYDQDHETIKAFEDEITRLTGKVLRKRHSKKPTVTPQKNDGGKKIPGTRRKGHGHQSMPLSQNTAGAQYASSSAGGQNLFTDIKKRRDEWHMMIGNICVQVQPGDITTETTDAIVNSTNERLDLSQGAVSKAILKIGGRTIMDECRQLGRQNPGSAVITGAGKLRCSKIIHLVTATQQNLDQSIMEILQLAERSGIKSLAMPAIGTGGLGIDSKDVANKTFQAIGDFFQKVHPHNLKLIRITIFQRQIVSVFQDAMTDLIAKPQTQDERGTFSKMFGAVKQVFGFSDKEDDRATPKQWNTVILDIYAGSEQAIGNAIKSIEKTMESESSDVCIDKDSVRKLSDEDMASLVNFAETLSVKVEKVDTGSVCRLLIQGGPRDVMQVQEKANTLLDRIHTEERLESEAKLMAKNVKWVFLNENEQLEEYDPLTTGFIEKAHHEKKQHVVVNIEGGRYKIDFKSMTEIDLDDLGGSAAVEVRRQVKEGGVNLPQIWANMAPSEQVKTVLLDEKSPEYDAVAKPFRQTLQSYALKQICKIERIQNPRFYRQYEVLKQNLDVKNKPGTQNEKRLYHGTSADSVSKINAGGFNRSFAGKNATYYGVGSYFAVNASYSSSSTYTPPDSSGKKYMYQAKVLTGEFARGAQTMLVPPSKNPNDPTDCYDSVTDNVQNPSIFVVFNDAMAYPEYLIVFQ